MVLNSTKWKSNAKLVFAWQSLNFCKIDSTLKNLSNDFFYILLENESIKKQLKFQKKKPPMMGR